MVCAMPWLFVAALSGVIVAQADNAEACSHDATALLQGNAQVVQHGVEPAPETAGASMRAQAAAPQSRLLTLPLQKQYVPLYHGGSLMAYRTSYFGEIFVGHVTGKQQSFKVVFDTGSGHLVLPSSSCKSPACEKHQRYSPVAKPDNEPGLQDGALRINFGTGEVRGEFARDGICLGSGSTDCVSAQMVVADEMSESPFLDFDFDGVLGLGLLPLTLSPRFSVFQQMVAQLPHLQPYFSFLLARDDSGQSVISFGGYDPKWAASEVKWVPVVMPEVGHWMVQLSGVRVGDVVLDECADGGCRAIFDTGTNLLGIPKQATRTLQRLLARPLPAGMAGPNADCRQVPGQRLHFDLQGGPSVSLDEEDYSRPRPFNLTSNSTLGWELYCRSLLLSVDRPPPLGPRVFVFGEPVLRKHLAVFDWAQKRVGVAASGQPPTVSADDVEADDSHKNVSAGASIPRRAAIGTPPSGSLLSGSPLPSRLPASVTL